MDGRRLALPVAPGLRVGWDQDLLSGRAALLGSSCPEQLLWARDSCLKLGFPTCSPGTPMQKLRFAAHSPELTRALVKYPNSHEAGGFLGGKFSSSGLCPFAAPRPPPGVTQADHAPLHTGKPLLN